MEEEHTIYRLRDPRYKHVRYVGRTNHPQQRLKEHKHAEMCSEQKGEWIKDLQGAGLDPDMEEIETIKGIHQARRHETRWIGYHIVQNDRLLNDEACNLSLVRVKGWRMQKDLSRKDLSAYTGIPMHLIGQIESNPDYRPFMNDLVSISAALELSVDDLMTPKTILAPSFEVGEKARWIYKPNDIRQKQNVCKEVVVTRIEGRYASVRVIQARSSRDTFTVNASYLFKAA